MPVLLGQRLRGQLEQHQVVGAGQRVVVAEVELVLAVRVFVVDLERRRARRRSAPSRSCVQEVALARQALQVVGRLVEPVAVHRPARGRWPSRLQQEELGLDAGPQRPAALGQAAIWRRSTWRGQASKGSPATKPSHDDARVARHPRQGARGAGVAAAVVLGARARCAAGRCPRSTGRQSPRHRAAPRRAWASGTQLALGHAVQVGELREQRVHALGGERFASASGRRCRGWLMSGRTARQRGAQDRQRLVEHRVRNRQREQEAHHVAVRRRRSAGSGRASAPRPARAW